MTHIMHYTTTLLMQKDHELHLQTHVILTNMAYDLVSDLMIADN
jgi:hypothetical protein